MRVAAVALALATVAPVAADVGAAERAVAQARAALTQGDGIAAQARLTEARKAGAGDDAIRALMGEALLAQGDLAKAREWLATARFTPSTRAHGWRMLGRLEMREGHLRESASAFETALEGAPDDAPLWSDIARLRYANGEQRQAIEAAERALEIDGGETGGLAFRAVLIRQQYGLAAALPWFEAGLRRAPGDPSILGDHAATLGDLGHARDSLTAIRALRKVDPGNPRIRYYQAVIAARAGKSELARSLLERESAALRDTPGAILLRGALELEAGNLNLALELLDRLVRYQPDNAAAQDLIARALARSGDPAAVADRFGPLARTGRASPYLMTLVARALEEQGRRTEAVALLVRAKQPDSLDTIALAWGAEPEVVARRFVDSPARAQSAVPYVRASLWRRQEAAARQAAARLVAANSGAPDAWLIAGDVEAGFGRHQAALERYQSAARIRFGEHELVRLDRALRQTGKERDADFLVFAFAVNNPRSTIAARLLANGNARADKWNEAARLLEWVAARRGRRDPEVLADLAFAHLQANRRAQARRLAAQAAALDPAASATQRIVALAAR